MSLAIRSANEIPKLKQQIPNKSQSAISKFQIDRWLFWILGEWNLKFICHLGFELWLLRFPRTAKFLRRVQFFVFLQRFDL